MRVDAHVHIWSLARGDYHWLKPDAGVLYRDVAADELRPLIEAEGVDRAILIQAAPTAAETDFLLRTASRTPWVAGVVGWADLRDADAVRQIARRPMLVGLRPMLQDMDDRAWILNEALDSGIGAMIEARLVFDALIRADQITVVAELARRHPGLSIVIDHAAKPAIGDDSVFAMWAGAMDDAAACHNVAVKLSGLLTEAAVGADVDDLRRYADHLITSFGADRLLWGSDWPVLTTVADYSAWSRTSDKLLAALSSDGQAAIRGATACRVYGLSQ